jgi:hypothetical protein
MKIISKEQKKFTDDEEFDIFCKDLFRAILKDDSARRYGRKGQKQFGIDIHSPLRLGPRLPFSAFPDKWQNL